MNKGGRKGVRSNPISQAMLGFAQQIATLVRSGFQGLRRIFANLLAARKYDKRICESGSIFNFAKGEENCGANCEPIFRQKGTSTASFSLRCRNEMKMKFFSGEVVLGLELN